MNIIIIAQNLEFKKQENKRIEHKKQNQRLAIQN